MCVVSLYDVTVALDGSGDFHSIEDAVHHAPLNDECYVIYIRNGIYHERFEINRPHVYLIGEDRDQTIIIASTANGMLDELGRKFATFGSRTLSINASDFRARSLTIQNGFDFPANQMKSDEDPTKLKHTQAVALLVSHHGDRAQFKDVRFVSYHDTLYLYTGRSYFEKCQIMGTVDFIFGGGTAVIEQSEIIARDRGDVLDDDEPYGYLTAPCTPIEQPFGFIFRECRLTKEPNVPCHRYRLGRPWHPTTQFADGCYADPDAIGQATFIHCDMDEHIAEWDKMGGRDRHQNTIWFYPEESRFFEYQNQGLGADTDHPHRPQLTAQQLENYTHETIFSGWQPDLSLGKTCVLRGEVLDPCISFPATIVVTDCFGQSKVTQTDHQGQYRLSVQSLTPPLLAVVRLDEEVSASHSVRALIVKVYHHGETIVHLNAFSDQIVASVLAGEWMEKDHDDPFVPALSRKAWQQAYDHAQGILNAIASEYQIDIMAQINPMCYGEENHCKVALLVDKLHQRHLLGQSDVSTLE